MLAYLAVGAALFAYMYLKNEEISKQHVEVVQKATTQAAQAAAMPNLATTPVVIAPPNPTTTTTPSGADNAIAVYSTPAPPSAASVPAASADVPPAADIVPAGTAVASTPLAAVAAIPAQPILQADPGTPPLQAALAQPTTPQLTTVVQSIPPQAFRGDDLVVHTSKGGAPSVNDPSPNQPIDQTPVQFIQPVNAPFILQPSQECRR